jgi:hypothetical protein
VHPPLLQLGTVAAHAPASPHSPFAPQVWIALPAHCVAKGLHVTHPPSEQTGISPAQAAPAATHCPPTHV